MTTAMERPYPLVFLSSTLRGSMAVPGGFRAERERIFMHGEQFGHNAVWVDEVIEPDRGPDPFAAIDDFLFELQRSRLYVAVVATDWAGSPIPIAGENASTTFFETELFYAAVLGRPIAVIVRTDIPIPYDTKNLLLLVKRVLPRVAWFEVGSASAAEARAKQLVEQAAVGGLGALVRRGHLGGLLERWWRWREPSPTATGLRWLDGRFLPSSRAPSHRIVQECLALTSAADSEVQRLSRLWIAARELMAEPYHRCVDSGWLSLWNQVLTAWSTAAAWYGLHGHLELGYMAALYSLADIRKAGRLVDSSLVDDPRWDPPNTSLASAYYALAHRVGSRRLRRVGLKKALSYLDTTVARDPISLSNALAIRGSILQKAMAFGSSVDAYREVLRIRQSFPGVSQCSVGEAMSELGFGLLFTFRWREGRDLLREGVRLMEVTEPRPGFLVRGKRKLAAGLLLTGDWRGARRERREASRLDDVSRVGRAQTRPPHLTSALHGE